MKLLHPHKNMKRRENKSVDTHSHLQIYCFCAAAFVYKLSARKLQMARGGNNSIHHHLDHHLHSVIVIYNVYDAVNCMSDACLQNWEGECKVRVILKFLFWNYAQPFKGHICTFVHGSPIERCETERKYMVEGVLINNQQLNRLKN